MENQEEVTKLNWKHGYWIVAVLAFFCYFFTTEAEGMEMFSALIIAICKAVVWPLSLLYSIFS